MRIASALAGLGALGAHLGMGRGAGSGAAVTRTGTATGTIAGGRARGGMVGGAKGGSFGALLRTEEERGASPKAQKKATATGDEPPQGPMLAQSALWAPPPGGAMAAAVAPAGAAEQQVRTSLEDLLPALVRRIAWSGDARRGTVRLELGAGALSGATLVVHADAGRVRVQLTAPVGADPAEWRARIEGRLAARGIDVEAVDVE